jgi:tagB2
MYLKSFNCLRAILITAKCGFFLSFKKEIMMNNIKKIVANPQTIAAVALLTIAQMTLADGFNDVNNIAVKVRQGIYVLVGTICGITMLWFFLQAKSGRKTWGDFLELSLYVVGAGASIAFATYLFTKGGSVSF